MNYELLLITRDSRGWITDMQPMDVEEWTVESDVSGRYRFTMTGSFAAKSGQSAEPPMSTRDELLARYASPELRSPGG